MTEQVQLPFYMCLKDGGPLCESDAPIVFEDVVDAVDALDESEDEEAFVAEVELEVIALRLREGGIGEVFYKPLAETGFVMDLDTFAGPS